MKIRLVRLVPATVVVEEPKRYKLIRIKKVKKVKQPKLRFVTLTIRNWF